MLTSRVLSFEKKHKRQMDMTKEHRVYPTSCTTIDRGPYL